MLFVTFSLGYCLAPQLRAAFTVHQVPTTTENPEPPAKSDPQIASATVPADQIEAIDEVTGLYDEPVKNSVKLLEIGEFDDSTFHPKNGESWLGLFEEGGKYFVRATKLRVSGGEMPKTDVPEQNKPLFLVKNAPMVREGRVNSIFRGVDYTIVQNLENRGVIYNDPMTKIDKEFNEIFQFSSKNYVLKVDEAKDKDGKKMLALFLSDGNIRQLLYAVPEEYSPSLGNMFWIGDLDHDGRPDIYCYLTEGEESGSSVLFLSSKAKKGSLVEIVAEFWTPGC